MTSLKIFNSNVARSYLCQIRSLSLSGVSNDKPRDSSVSKNASDGPSAPSPSDLMFSTENKSNQKAENISRAMSYYLNKLRERGSPPMNNTSRFHLYASWRKFFFYFLFLQSIESVLSFKSQEYEIGKRHLARMMGLDPDSFPKKYVYLKSDATSKSSEKNHKIKSVEVIYLIFE